MYVAIDKSIKSSPQKLKSSSSIAVTSSDVEIWCNTYSNILFLHLRVKTGPMVHPAFSSVSNVRSCAGCNANDHLHLVPTLPTSTPSYAFVVCTRTTLTFFYLSLSYISLIRKWIRSWTWDFLSLYIGVLGFLGFYLIAGLFIPAVWKNVSSSFSRFKEPHNDGLLLVLFQPWRWGLCIHLKQWESVRLVLGWTT